MMGYGYINFQPDTYIHTYIHAQVLDLEQTMYVTCMYMCTEYQHRSRCEEIRGCEVGERVMDIGYTDTMVIWF